MDTGQGSMGPIRRSRRRAAINHRVVSTRRRQNPSGVEPALPTQTEGEQTQNDAAVRPAPAFPSTSDIAAEVLRLMMEKGVTFTPQGPQPSNMTAPTMPLPTHSGTTAGLEQSSSTNQSQATNMPASWVTLPHSATAAFAQQSSTRPLQPSVLATPTASNLPTRQLLPSTSLQTTPPVLDPYSLQSPIQNAVAGFTGTDTCLPHTPAYSSISRPLDVHLDSKIKAKIMCNEFVEFGALLSTKSHPDQFQLQVQGNNLSLVPNTKKIQIKTTEQWVQAFHIFVSVYVQAHPTQTVSLLKYADTIQTLSRRSGFAAAMFYDNNFRKWLQVNQAMPWDELNNELYMQALGIGLKSVQKASQHTAQQPFPANNPNMFQKGKCWDFLKTGICSRGSNCKFLHACSKCGGQHGPQQCRKGADFSGGKGTIQFKFNF
ncbi:uncharacterized protein LOC110452313 [Mizuhopecten yessoensis]|uniref:uncharacterized protein LOC110452313 n=1 Tax=Mizuhopecten yessoensis TaxID=6573 RepID=UPI000B45F72F|nr:uncharacterized protein LOC110452313 [Mizuhopecten yessoensis]